MRPHMKRQELKCFERYLSAASSYLEYGSGGSTVMAAEIPDLKIQTIESDKVWLDELATKPAVKTAIDQKRLSLVHVDIGPTGQWGRPIDESGRDRWPNYQTAPWRGDYCPDLILIDGRFRVACAIQTALRLKNDAHIIVHDYRSRNQYHEIERFFKLVEEWQDLAVFSSAEIDRPAAEDSLKKFEYDSR
jgi:hypothetical protein